MQWDIHYYFFIESAVGSEINRQSNKRKEYDLSDSDDDFHKAPFKRNYMTYFSEYSL